MRTFYLSGVFALLFLWAGGQRAFSQSITDQIVGKWKVVWFSDDKKEIDMEEKNQLLVLRRDGTGTMTMGGQKVGDATWSELGKKKIAFADDPSVPAYTVKIKMSNDGNNMLFAGKMPNGVTRRVYFRALSSKEQ